MAKIPGIALYNQDRFGDAEFLASFVARKKQTEALLNSLRYIADGGPNEHQILIGARGMGKTSLLRRLAIGIMEDPKLKASFIPLRFREEQYNIISLDAFWRNCGESLAEWCEQQGNQALADQLDVAIETPEWRDENKARDAFLAACSEVGGRAVLLLDNLDLILDGITPKGCWALRATLQKKDGPIVVGAATALLTQGAKRDSAFYEFFHPHILEPLTEHELLACLNALASYRGNAGKKVKATLAREPERVRALYVLTGGNPRILGLIYGLLEKPNSSEIFADLEALLDQVTPFYKARIEEYQTPLQRAVIDGIALNWDPITSNALSKQTGVEATTLSGQLSRFKRDGLVEEVDTSGTRAGYQLAERFLNIWYLMRHGTRKTKQRLRWFTIFLTKLFNVDELERMAGEAQLGKAHWKAEHCEAVIDAYNLKKLSLGGKNLPDKESNVLSALFEKAKRQIESHNVTEAIVMLDDLLDQMADAGATVAIAMVLSAKGSLLRAEKCYDEAIQIFDEVIRRFADSNEPQLLEVVAEAFTQKGQALAQLGRFSDANLTFDLTIKKFENSDDTKIQQSTARAMVGKAFALGDLDRLDEAIETFELVDARFGQNTDQGTMDAVATALAVKGIDLLQLGRHDEAIGIFDIIESRFDKNVSDDISWTVANALVVKGITYAMLGQSDIAIKTFESVIQRFYSSIDGMLSKPVLRAYANMADLLSELGRFEESNSVYNEMNARFGDQEWNELDISLSSAIAKMFVHSFWIVGRREVSVRKLQTIAQNNHDQAIFKTSLFWMFMAMENRDEADRLASELEALTGGAKALFQAGIDLSADNIGASLLHLAEALQLGLEGEFDFSEDLLWYLRIAVERGYGEKLINWFDESGNADRYAPVYGALVAHIKGEGHLLDLNPEVRSVAKPLFAKLSAGKQTSAKGTKKRERQ